ncbi:addiction module protein [Sorangium sp. So ce693]|uniref:addiction module protein n=1 Tax=Sorangium sp. So ce693 TaxID=3133318 RepID=UPI003F5F3BDF
MPSDLEDVLAAALRLPGKARAALAAELLQSLDQVDADGDDVEEAWTDEIKRRLDDVDAGTVTPIPWPESRRRLLAAAGGRTGGSDDRAPRGAVSPQASLLARALPDRD